jgi:Holliday junction resolvase
MSGRRSRNKGARTERSIVNALQAKGIAAVRVPLSGAVGGRFAGDVVLPLMGRDLCIEVKARADGFRELYCWLHQRDVLIVKADRQEPLVVLRRSDLIRMCWTDIETYDGREGINVIQKKTGRKIWVPILSTLATALATWERQPGPFLRRMDGRPWNRVDLSNQWERERDRNPALIEHSKTPLVLHGLRAHACVRLRRAGANAQQIADMVGMGVPMVERYCRFSVQRENATAALLHMETFRERGVGMSRK